MIVSAPGPQRIAPRLRFDQVVNPASALTPKRVRIVADTAVRGVPVYRGSVLEFDTATHDGFDDYCNLLNCLKAIRVPIDTPTVIHREPVPPPLPDVPKKK
jgi:hypothetical protein